MLSSNTSAVSGDANYIEDVFSTHLYTGNGASQSINNGIALGNSATSNSSVSLTASNPSYLTFSAEVNLSGDFCIQAWVYPNSLTNTRVLFSSTSNTNVQFPRIQENGGIYCYANGTTIMSGSAASALQAGRWTHLAMTRSGSTFRAFVDGVLYDTTTYSGTFDLGVLGVFFYNGSLYSTPYAFDGKVSNAQIVSGLPVYTANFTPPQNTLTGGSVLLGAGATPLADTSGTGKTVTQFGSPTSSTSGPWSVGEAKGGMVWIKKRGAGTADHHLYDTNRGATYQLASDLTNGTLTRATGLTAFNSNGFSIGAYSEVNGSTDPTVSWSFAKATKFFDVVTYTGNAVAGRTISHNLGSTPGCIIVKQTSAAGQDWMVYHRSLATNGYLLLNSTGAASTYPYLYGPTSTTFTVDSSAPVNANGATYVAYIFAHDAGGFGLTGTDNVISCGSFTGSGSTVSVNLGYEAQFVIIKNTTTALSWVMHDNMRGLPVASNSPYLLPNSSQAEGAVVASVSATSTGFQVVSGNRTWNSSDGDTYIYIAIRRGPMKVPTDATKVFKPVAYTGTSATRTITGVGFPLDMNITMDRAAHTYNVVSDRLRGISCDGTATQPQLRTNATDAEASIANGLNGTSSSAMDGYTLYGAYSQMNASPDTYISYNYRRAPSFFDEVCYTGTGANRTVTHNLGVTPELMIVKNRVETGGERWTVYSSALTATKALYLNETFSATTASVFWNNTEPTATVFSVGTAGNTNTNAQTYVAYLFATCAGVSKVGSYTGTGTTKQVDCGFAAGARFVLIKRTDDVGDWYVWDTARGIVSGNDPYFLLNSNVAEVTSTDYIDTYSAGFELSSTAPAALNASGGTYIFLAIA